MKATALLIVRYLYVGANCAGIGVTQMPYHTSQPSRFRLHSKGDEIEQHACNHSETLMAKTQALTCLPNQL